MSMTMTYYCTNIIVTFFSLSVISTMSQHTVRSVRRGVQTPPPAASTAPRVSAASLAHMPTEPPTWVRRRRMWWVLWWRLLLRRYKLQFILPYVTLNNVPVQCDEGCELCMYTGAALSHAAQYPHRLRERETPYELQAAPGAKSAHIISSKTPGRCSAAYYKSTSVHLGWPQQISTPVNGSNGSHDQSKC